MRSLRLLAIPMTAALLLGACGNGSSGLRSPGGSTASGGGEGQSTIGANGGSQGSTSLGGVSGGTSGPTSISTVGGGAGNVGGSSTSPHGGSTKTGGSSTAMGTTGVGGQSPNTSSPGASGGRTGVGGTTTTSAGGSSRGGNTSTSGSTSTPRNPDASVSDGGIVASDYCEGQSPKLTYQGQTVTPGVTDFRSNIALDCCNGYGVNLHTSASLGFDVVVELILSLPIYTPGEYDMGEPSSIRARSAVRKSSDALTALAGGNAQGKLRIFGTDGSASAAELGLCLEVNDATSTLDGTRIYVPRVIIGSYQSSNRFQLFLLKDSSLHASSLSAQSLDSLVLADSPILDLNRIAYVERATTKIGFNPDEKLGDSLRTRLGTPLDMPFVAMVDGARIYLGSIISQVSSIGPTGPNIYVEEITPDGLTIHAPAHGADPRNDDRIIKVLSELGKLVP